MKHRIVATVVLILTLTVAAIVGEMFGLPDAIIAVPLLALPATWAVHKLGVGK